MITMDHLSYDNFAIGNVKTAAHLCTLNEILGKVKGQGLVGAVVNTKSRLWYNGENGRNRELIGNVLMRRNLKRLNCIFKYHTFETANGRSNVDATPSA